VTAPGSELAPSAPEALLDRVRRRLASSRGEVDLISLAREESALVVDSEGLAELSGQLAADLSGAGRLERLLELPGVTDVLVNSPDAVFIDRGRGLERADVRFADDAAIRALAVRLASQAGRRLDDAMPYVDASLPDGTRLHAMLSPLVAHPVICLRVLGRRKMSLVDLVAAGMMPACVAQLLRAVVAARLTTLISGGTGSGKTTLLGALLSEVPAAERIITVEDAAELTSDHPHVVALLARSANVEGAGGIGLAELVRQSLRMRCDRVVVGEFRGAEIVEMLAALNTGHAGGAATVHANSAADVPARLVALAALGGMPDGVLAAQAASALDLVIQLDKDSGGVRLLNEIALWPRDSMAALPPTTWTVWSAAGRDGLRGSGLGPAAPELARRIDAAGVAMPSLLGGLQW
jgi:pilus assembly protein CpaF